jgi:hypothetical protein
MEADAEIDFDRHYCLVQDRTTDSELATAPPEAAVAVPQPSKVLANTAPNTALFSQPKPSSKAAHEPKLLEQQANQRQTTQPTTFRRAGLKRSSAFVPPAINHAKLEMNRDQEDEPSSYNLSITGDHNKCSQSITGHRDGNSAKENFFKQEQNATSEDDEDDRVFVDTTINHTQRGPFQPNKQPDNLVDAADDVTEESLDALLSLCSKEQGDLGITERTTLRKRSRWEAFIDEEDEYEEHSNPNVRLRWHNLEEHSPYPSIELANTRTPKAAY